MARHPLSAIPPNPGAILVSVGRTVVVVGSINEDFVLRVDRRPAPGETIGNAVLVTADGGKGANQAVAAATHGAETALVARVGDDRRGGELIAGLEAAGVDTRWVSRTAGLRSGAAFVLVTPDGENQIVVAPGANDRLLPDDVERAASVVGDAGVLVLQMEVSGDTVAAAVSLAGPGTTVVLNAAPARDMPSKVWERIDVLVVNQNEAGTLLGEDQVDPAGAVASLLLAGPATVVVTSGASGATVASGGETWLQPAPPVRVVDTTGAGDVLVGVLAAELSRSSGRRPGVGLLRQAIELAVGAASQSVGHAGARRPGDRATGRPADDAT
jgi:ribokinase